MTLSQSVASELLEAFRAGESVDLIRESVRLVMQDLIEVDAAERVGAGRYERSESRTTQRNGSRPKVVSTQAGDVELTIPKLRQGSFFPVILERRRRIDQALYAVVMEAWVNGVSTRAVDDLVQALGIGTGISKSEVSRICSGLDEQVAAFHDRTLHHTTFPYVFLDATYLHVRRTGQVTSMAVVVATGVTADGGREILGVDVGDSEDEVFWRGFLRTLRERGLNGVQIVISHQHAGLVAALARQMQGVVHQRCRVHFARNLLALVPKSHTDMVAAVFRTAFAQPDAAAASQAWDEVRDRLARSFPKIGPLMDAAKAEVLAFTGFPRSHWTKIWSTNPIERINREIKRRARVVGIFLRVCLDSVAGPSGFAVTLGEEPGVTRNLCVGPVGLDLVGASPPALLDGGRVTSERRVDRTAGLSATTDPLHRWITERYVMEILTTIGVDAHSQVHVAAAVDPQGRVVSELAVAAGNEEFERFVGWVQGLPAPRQVAVEGAKGYGRTLTQRLLAAGETVVDVATTLTPRGGGGAADQARTTRATLS